MKITIYSTVKYFLFLAIAIILLWFTFRNQNINQLWESIKEANFYWVFLSVGISIVAHWIRAIRWKMLINTIGHQPKTTNTFHAIMIGYLGNIAFPKMGEVSRCAVLHKTDDIPLNALIGTVIIERIIDVAFLFALLLLSFALLYDKISNYLIQEIVNPLYLKLIESQFIGLVIIALVVTIFSLFFFLRRNKELLQQISIIKKITEFLNGMKDGFLSILKLENNLKFFLYSILIWVCYLLSTYFVFFSITATSNLTLVIGLFIMAAGAVGMAAPVQGGIGTYEASVSIALVIFGISESDGLTYATISHASQILSIIIFAAISLMIVFLFNKKQKQ